ncbi:hypothetical protein O1R50_17765 [Glycomyces luteolus]|uniref:Uncharacterized protein n=1 Tax=Glycomyces luteolus TaxID=2670330 RepID=A0A9X3T4T3_9ACTN|nr:hypothetical protein [Glycomyces luteolus]MDA1361480.1 hypothetical protein [Glycomyces luteolus]
MALTAQIMKEFERVGADHPGAQILMSAIAGHTDHEETAEERYYRFVVDTTLAGLERLLPHRTGSRSHPRFGLRPR